MEKRRHLVLAFLILFLVFSAVSASNQFVLVHGACLGAWSWYKLVPLLQASGHRVTAIDLAASGINLLHTNDLKSFSDYSQPLIDFMASVPPHQRVILVGHSLGGAVISQAMEHYPGEGLCGCISDCRDAWSIPPIFCSYSTGDK